MGTCVYRDSHCDIEPRAWPAHPYCSAKSVFHLLWDGIMSAFRLSNNNKW